MAADEPKKGAEDISEEQQEQAAQDARAEDDAVDGGFAENPELQAAIDEAVEAALSEQRDSVLRAQAEVQNMRRRCEQDVERAHKYALEKFGASLLTVADNLERALQAVPEQPDPGLKAFSEGVDLTLKSLLETFSKFDIQQINPEGEPFDPQLHEAMSMLPNPDVEPNTVMTVVQKGYMLNGRVLRPAMVIVAKAP